MGDVIKLVDIKSAEDAINRMGIEDLRLLNRLIVNRANYLASVQRDVQLLKFGRGDQVQFTTKHGERIEGTVVRVNKKTVSVQVIGDDGLWKVSPGLLTKI